MWGGAGATCPLSLLLPIAHPLGTNFFPSPTFRCCKKSKTLDIILTKEILSTHSPGTSLQATVTEDLIQTIETYSAYKKYKKKKIHISFHLVHPITLMVHTLWKWYITFESQRPQAQAQAPVICSWSMLTLGRYFPSRRWYKRPNISGRFWGHLRNTINSPQSFR